MKNTMNLFKYSAQQHIYMVFRPVAILALTHFSVNQVTVPKANTHRRANLEAFSTKKNSVLPTLHSCKFCIPGCCMSLVFFSPNYGGLHLTAQSVALISSGM